VLITIAEAAAVLGLKSRGSIYRKVKSGELLTVESASGVMIEREGLEDVWERITRLRADSPRKGKERQSRKVKAEQNKPAAEIDAKEDIDDSEIPDFNEERARNEREKRLHERQKRQITELDRRQKEGQLVYKADVEQAQMAVALTLKNQLEALPKQIKQQLPHLSIGDEEMIERLVAKVLTAVADWRMSEEEEE
jgi:phage terminase Nu1 subunit (DNA packaging protein)